MKKRTYTGIIAIGMALLMAVSLVCFTVPSFATSDTSDSATSGTEDTDATDEAATAEEAEEADAEETQEAEWYPVAERVDPASLPESLHSFMAGMASYDGDYDCENPVPEEGEPHLLYNALKTYSVIGYDDYPGLLENLTAVVFEHEEQYLIDSVKDTYENTDTAPSDPLQRFYAPKEEDDTSEAPAEPDMIIGYYMRPAEHVDWVLKNIFHCSPSAIAKMRTMPQVETDDHLWTDSYYYKGNYYSMMETGLGGPTESAKIIDAYYDGKGYDLYLVEGMLDPGISFAEDRIRHARVAQETIGGEEYWTLYKYETMPNAIPLQAVAAKDDATKKQIAAAESIIENVGFDNAAESYDVGKSEKEQLVLLFEDEEAALSVYDCIPADYEKEHTLLIRTGEGEDELRRYINVTTRPDHLDFSMSPVYPEVFALTWCTGHGTGFYQSEMLFCFVDPHWYAGDTADRELMLLRMPTDKICEQIEEMLELRFDNAEAHLEIADLRTADYRLLSIADGDADKFEKKPVEEMRLSEIVRQYRMDGVPTLQLCIQPVGVEFADGMYLGDFRVALYPEMGIEPDSVNRLYIGPLTETNLH